MKRISEEIEKEAIKLYKNRFSLNAAAKELKISAGTVRRILKRNRICIRSISEGTRKYTLDENYFADIDTYEKAQILGLIYADGCNFISSKKYMKLLKINLQFEDEYYLDKIRNAIKYTGPIRKYQEKTKKGYISNMAGLTIANPKISDDLLLHGVMPNKTFLLEFPYQSLPLRLYKSFILGYLEGDGGFYWYGRANNFRKYDVSFSITGRLGICEAFKKIFQEQAKVNFYIAKANKNNSKDTYRIGVYEPEDCLKFGDWLYSDIDKSNLVMTRKHNKFVDFRTEMMFRDN